MPKQHGFETIKLRLHGGCAPELQVEIMPLPLELDLLFFDAAPLFVKFRTDCGIGGHLALLTSERQG